MAIKKPTVSINYQKLDTIHYGKYRNLLVLVASFLGLVAFLSIMSFFAANRFAKSTQEIEVVTQQGVIVEQLSKNLLDVNLFLAESLRNTPTEDNTVQLQNLSQTALYRIEEVKAQQAMFAEALKALQQGGKVTLPSGKVVDVDALDSEHLKVVLNNIQQMWTPYVGLLDNFSQDTARGTIKKETSDYLVDYTRLYNQALQGEISDISVSLSATAQDQAGVLKFVQIVGILIAIGLFVAIIFGALRQLVNNDKLLEAARRETTEIMTTVSTGLFLLDKELNIGHQYSNALEGIMGTKRLAGENLTTVLRNRISDKDLDTTRQFIQQLYNPRVKETLVNDLNPLNKIMFRDEETSKNRYLDFKFSRVYENKEIVRILVNVNDVSNAVLLEQRLEKERAQNDLQIEMLTTILNVHPKVIQEFITNTMDHINKINNVLKNPGSSQFELQAKLKSIYREMHSLKGEASALKLHNFTKIATDAEDKMYILQNQSQLSGNDFLPLTVHLDELLTLANTISKLGERIAQAANAPASTSSNNDRNFKFLEQDAQQSQRLEQEQQVSRYYQNFVKDIASRQNKLVHLQLNAADFSNIPAHLENVVKEISIQLLRNAVVHGIEYPNHRISQGKADAGLLVLKIQKDAHQLTLTLEDDGQGIDYTGIRKKLVEQGKYTAEQVNELTESQLMNILFTSGFSTRNSVDEDGGRGVGLDIIKDRVSEFHGKLNVHSVTGQGTQFVISLPL